MRRAQVRHPWLALLVECFTVNVDDVIAVRVRRAVGAYELDVLHIAAAVISSHDAPLPRNQRQRSKRGAEHGQRKQNPHHWAGALWFVIHSPISYVSNSASAAWITCTADPSVTWLPVNCNTRHPWMVAAFNFS